MVTRTSVGTLFVALFLAACQAASPRADGAMPAAAASTPPEIVRGGDPYARGWTDDDFPRVKQLADGVYTYETLRTPDLGATTNTLIVVTSEGVLVADGQGSVEAGQAMVEEIARITPRPIRWVVVGSDHGDHRGGDSAYPEDAVFIASAASAAVLKETAAGRGPGAAPVHLADQIVKDTLVLHLGGREVQILNLGRAHTGGDLVVHLPSERILYASEVFASHVFPSMSRSFPSEAVATMERVQAMDAALYVPAHGFVDPPFVLEEELEAYKQAWMAVIAETRRLYDLGVRAEDVPAQADFGEYNAWIGSERQTPRNTPRIYEEFDGKLPGPI